MALGVMHDLAVGVNSRGADAWSLQDSYAAGVTVGVPPDAFNQRGQDWNQPPWRPDRLAATAYAPVRDMVSTILRHAGGLRVDHVMGCSGCGGFRRHPPHRGHPALNAEAISAFSLEAHRAERCGRRGSRTVEPWVVTPAGASGFRHIDLVV